VNCPSQKKTGETDQIEKSSEDEADNGHCSHSGNYSREFIWLID
jgi:hypothetical protein